MSVGNEVICIGGSDADRHYAEVFRLEWTGGALRTTELQPLPRPLANASGALLGSTLYVAGGLASPDAAETLRIVYRIDLSAANPVWENVEPWPGRARMIAVAAAYDGAFWVVGGTDLVAGPGGKPERRYLRDAYRYEPGRGWTQLPDLPRPVVGAPSPAAFDHHGFFIVGGDDGTQVNASPAAHRGFSDKVLRYDRSASRWVEAGRVPAPRVTAPCVAWHGSWVVPSGEVRPGVRSPDVLCFTPRISE